MCGNPVTRNILLGGILLSWFSCDSTSVTVVVVAVAVAVHFYRHLRYVGQTFLGLPILIGLFRSFLPQAVGLQAVEDGDDSAANSGSGGAITPSPSAISSQNSDTDTTSSSPNSVNSSGSNTNTTTPSKTVIDSSGSDAAGTTPSPAMQVQKVHKPTN